MDLSLVSKLYTEKSCAVRGIQLNLCQKLTFDDGSFIRRNGRDLVGNTTSVPRRATETEKATNEGGNMYTVERNKPTPDEGSSEFEKRTKI